MITKANITSFDKTNPPQFSSGVLKKNRQDFILEIESKLNNIKPSDKKDLLVTPEALPLSLLGPRIHGINEKYKIDTRVSWEQVGFLQESRDDYVASLKRQGIDKVRFDEKNKDRFLNIYYHLSDDDIFDGEHPDLDQSDVSKLQQCFLPYFRSDRRSVDRFTVLDQCKNDFRALISSDTKLTRIFNEFCNNQCDAIDKAVQNHGLAPMQYVKWVNSVREEAVREKKNIALFHAMSSMRFDPVAAGGSIESTHVSVAVVSEKGDYLRIIPDLRGSEIFASQEENKADIYNSNFHAFDGNKNTLVDCKPENDRTPHHLKSFGHHNNLYKTGCYPQRSEYGCASLAIAYAVDLLKNNAYALREYSLLGSIILPRQRFFDSDPEVNVRHGYVFIPPHPLRHAQSPTHVNVMRNFMAEDDESVEFDVGYKKVSQFTVAGLEAHGMSFTKLDGTQLKEIDLKQFRVRWVEEHDRIQDLQKTKAMMLLTTRPLKKGKATLSVSQSLALAYLAHKDIRKSEQRSLLSLSNTSS